MRIETREIVLINEYLAKEGVICVEDSLANHKALEISNKTIMSYIKTLVSKGYVKKTFVWKHAYIRLTDEGFVWLKEHFCLEDNELPLTHAGEVYEKVEEEEVKENEE